MRLCHTIGCRFCCFCCCRCCRRCCCCCCCCCRVMRLCHTIGCRFCCFCCCRCCRRCCSPCLLLLLSRGVFRGLRHCVVWPPFGEIFQFFWFTPDVQFDLYSPSQRTLDVK